MNQQTIATIRAAFVLGVIFIVFVGSVKPQVGQIVLPESDSPTFEVATIKIADPNATNPRGFRPLDGGVSNGVTIRSYIKSAFGLSPFSQGQVLGGPAWIDKDLYVINGKISDDLRGSMNKMAPKEQFRQSRLLCQSLLFDRFALKEHLETRILPIFELTAGKGGVKMKAVPPPPQFVSGGAGPTVGGPGPTVGGPGPTVGGPGPTVGGPGPTVGGPGYLPPGALVVQTKSGGVKVMNARATTLSKVIELLRAFPEIGGRPILDKTGFSKTFDIVDMEWTDQTPEGETDAPSLITALEEKLGLKLMLTKGPDDVIIIDSIQRPSQN